MDPGFRREFDFASLFIPVIKPITTFTDAPLHIIEGPELSFSGSHAPRRASANRFTRRALRTNLLAKRLI